MVFILYAPGHDTPGRARPRQDRVWSVSEVAVLKVVSAAIGGLNVALVIRFEHIGVKQTNLKDRRRAIGAATASVRLRGFAGRA